mmetsp:Transcript_63551/g.151539  ORF Transcript_63551/g.151539 Transcript_63551/m.151539 type:complete len:230 (-) Transcript_63551:254-943(-)
MVPDEIPRLQPRQHRMDLRRKHRDRKRRDVHFLHNVRRRLVPLGGRDQGGRQRRVARQGAQVRIDRSHGRNEAHQDAGIQRGGRVLHGRNILWGGHGEHRDADDIATGGRQDGGPQGRLRPCLPRHVDGAAGELALAELVLLPPLDGVPTPGRQGQPVRSLLGSGRRQLPAHKRPGGASVGRQHLRRQQPPHRLSASQEHLHARQVRKRRDDLNPCQRPLPRQVLGLGA